MEQALGWLGWTPDAFWGATLAEVTAGVMGYLETKGQARQSAKGDAYGALYEMALEARRAEIRAAQANA